MQASNPRRLPGNPESNPRFSEGDDLFRRIFLSSEDAIFLLSATAGEFLDLNPRASAIFGYTRQEFLQVPPRRTICTYKDQWELLLDSVSNERDKWLRGMGCRQKSGRMTVRDILPSVVQIGGKSHILVTVRDARQRELSELLRANARLMHFSNAVAAGAGAAPTSEHAIRFCLRQVCDYFHWVFGHAHMFSERIPGARVPLDVWHFGLHERANSIKATIAAKRLIFQEEWYSRILATRRAALVVDLETEPELLANLEVRNLGLSSALAAPIVVGSEVAGICQYFSDEPINRERLFQDIMANLAARLGQIIEQKQAQERVHRLSARLFHAQDDDRRQLARELHDTTAQNVAAILMDLGIIDRCGSALTPEARHALCESLSLARQSLQEIRSFSYLIHPPMLDELGLIPALRIFIEGFSQRSGMHVHLEMPDSSPQLSKQLETTIFRVIQEALSNARRHSGSSTADVKLNMNPTELKLSVGNETTGDLLWGQTGVQSAKLGVGIRSMQERVQHLGGHLTFDIGKNRTVLQVFFPLRETTRATSA
jgi:PAS domain S-box-containing protein